MTVATLIGRRFSGRLGPASADRPGHHRRWAVPLALAVAGMAVFLAAHGHDVLPHDEDAPAFGALNDLRDRVDEHRNSSPVFLFFVNYLRYGVSLLVDAVRSGLDGLGWAGVVAAAGALAGLLAGWRVAVFTVAGFLFFGGLGLWQESIDTLALTLAAVLLSLLIGIPLGIAAAHLRWLRAALSPVLDVMQIMPTFAYLAPMTLFFLIGAPSATVATMIYAIPPAIRITALGIESVSPAAVEAAASLGSTRWQILRKVQLPMARRTIILGVNQTIMMALSMVVVTALIDAPGLGDTIVRALERVDIGAGFDAGLAIVVMAIILDRVTCAAARRRRLLARAAFALAVGVVVAALGQLTGLGRGVPQWPRFSSTVPVDATVRWAESALYPVTSAVSESVTAGLLNPLQAVLTGAPWWLVLASAFLLGLRASGVRAACVAVAALGSIVFLGLWQHAMETLSLVLVATVITMSIGGALGVLAAGRDGFAAGIRPLLDAAQTMPAFVYLLPAVALFGATRFTAIVAVVIYAVPAVVRLVERGIRDVPAPVVEAAVAAGSTPRQVLWKVRLPLARRGLLLALNQGIVMVLAMVVVGGMVGAGALGYDVVAGFSQREDFGKGLAAGISIVLLGVLLDRLSQGAARARNAPTPNPTPTTPVTPTPTTPVTPTPTTPVTPTPTPNPTQAQAQAQAQAFQGRSETTPEYTSTTP